MKHILKIFTLLLLIVVVACQKGDPIVDPSDKVELIIGIKASGIDYSPLPQPTKSNTGIDLMAIQIYEVVDGGTLNPYANGLFSDWSTLSFKGYSNSTYKVEATMVVDASEKLHKSGDEYGKPFNTSVGEFSYGGEALSGLSSNVATLSDGAEYIIPNIDRYYGTDSKAITIQDAVFTIMMKRVSFGVRIEGAQGDAITLKIKDAPEVNISSVEIAYFSFKNIITAYNSDESSSPYSENMEVEVLSNGATIFSGNTSFQRNKLAVVTIEDGDVSIGFDFEKPFEGEEEPEITIPEGASAYVNKVLDYRPAPGQFVNKMPEYVNGDTQQTMNQKVLEAIGGAANGAITLGGYGGYVIVGFDHTIPNIEGKRDIWIKGNAFYSADNPDPSAPVGGSCEAGIIMVAYDANGNKQPDEDEWYEIAGSAHKDHTAESWYEKAVNAGNDVNFYRDYQLTYQKPTKELEEGYDDYIDWSDNKNGNGTLPKNMFNTQSYYPEWISDDALTFSGSRLPQNGINEGSADSPYYVLYKFDYGYADNEMDEKDDSSIDISWAVDRDGKSIKLPGVDFVKIYNGVHQVNGWLGETSTEVVSIADLHVLKKDIPTR